MHAGVASVRFKPGKAEEAVRIYQNSVVPELRQMRGFEGGYVLMQAETDIYGPGLGHFARPALCHLAGAYGGSDSFPLAIRAEPVGLWRA